MASKKQRRRIYPETSGKRVGNPAVPPRVSGEEAGGGAAGARALWFSALVLIILGYLSLTRVDAGGRNAWSVISPAFLLTGYLLFLPAILRSFRK